MAILESIGTMVPSSYNGSEEPTEIEIDCWYSEKPSEGFLIAVQEMTAVIGRLRGANEYLQQRAQKLRDAGHIAPETERYHLALVDGRTEIINAVQAHLDNLKLHAPNLFRDLKPAPTPIEEVIAAAFQEDF